MSTRLLHPRSLLLVLLATWAPVVGAFGESDEVRHAALRDQFRSQLSPDQFAELQFLEDLGWRLVEAPGAERVEVYAGTPCRRVSLADAQARGDLQIRVPPGVHAAEIRRFAPTLAHLAVSTTSRCAYQLKLEPGFERAIQKLSENAESGRYGFPELFGLTFPTFQCKPPRPEWVEIITGRLWRAASSPSAAIESIYNKTSVIECYVAQWIAVWAAQYELYGAEWFDQAFSLDEVAIGTSRAIRETEFGQHMKVDRKYPYWALLVPDHRQCENVSLVLLEHGRKALVGLGGIVKCQILAIDSFENITVVSLSEAAAESLRRNGGFGWYECQARKIWAMQDEINGLFVAQRHKRKRREQIDRMLADPAFTEMMVYIHPYGVLSIGEVARTKLKKNSTPISVGLYTHGREDALFLRYHEAFKRRVGSD